MATRRYECQLHHVSTSNFIIFANGRLYPIPLNLLINLIRLHGSHLTTHQPKIIFILLIFCAHFYLSEISIVNCDKIRLHNTRST
uniref:Uncharacterized protein n=1 Tax=Kalanchoe fedtschenkoi TaxID=63787 RepID=A0A7N0TV80_KALFE